MSNETEVEATNDDIGENDQDITKPFATKDIKITNATVLLPSLIKRLENNELDIPDFQRHADLWDPTKMGRLIESILLKLPLPIFYFDVSNVDKWIVVDGLQRISTIRKFFVDKDLRLKNLEFLVHLNGKKYTDLERNLQRTIDETQLLTYQIEAQTPKKVRYSIFNRINTGGLQLNAQEIRQALNQEGGGVKFLAKIVETEEFKNIIGISNKRMAGQELTLRFMAFKVLDEIIFNRMSEFLDSAMGELDEKDEYELSDLKDRFISAIKFSEDIFGKGHKFSRYIANKNNLKLINKSLFDVLTVCFDEIENKDKFLQNKDIFVTKLQKLLNDENSDFLKSITEGTSGKTAQEVRFRTIRQLIKEVLNEN